MNNITRFETAYENTKKHGLRTDPSPFPLKPPISDAEIEEIKFVCIELLSRMGMPLASHVANKCTLVHANLRDALGVILGIDSYLTIGDINLTEAGSIYCEMTNEDITRELKNPNSGAINCHAWLTLSDGTIIDVTAIPSMEINLGKPDFYVNLTDIAFQRPHLPQSPNIYRPNLVGLDYLIKTRTLGDRPMHPVMG